MGSAMVMATSKSGFPAPVLVQRAIKDLGRGTAPVFHLQAGLLLESRGDAV